MSNPDFTWRRVGSVAWVVYYLLAAPLALVPLFVIVFLPTLVSDFSWLAFFYLTALLVQSSAYFATPIAIRRGKGRWRWLPLVVMMANYLLYLAFIAVAQLTGHGASAGYDALVIPYVCLLPGLLGLAVFADPGFFRRIKAK